MTDPWDPELVHPTYLENWPVELRALTVHQAGFPINPLDLALNQVELFETWEVPGIGSLDTIRASLNTYIPRVMAQAKAPGVFVRLGSRSPKDSYFEVDGRSWALQGPWPIETTSEALGVLLGTSERINDDLHAAVAQNYRPWLWVRAWDAFKPFEEFRCFVRNGKLIAISQYDYRIDYPALHESKSLYINSVVHFVNKRIIPALHMQTVVVDVYVQINRMPSGRGRKASTRLLEINPYFEHTDPCLFTWDELPELPEGMYPVAKIT